jgi:hypothetical protein
MKNWIKVAMVVATIVAVPASPTLCAPRLTLRVSASVAAEPATILVVARIEPDARNRTLSVAADSGAYLRATEIPLDGDRDAATQEVWFKSLPAGQYEIVAQLRGTDGLQARATAHMQVMPLR